MIISHKNKYLFIEIPHTGSTAIHRELCENYDGTPILGKHTNYFEFLRAATPEERKYFVFAGVRNPLSEAVSLYFKYKTNHHGKFTNPERLAKNSGNVTKSKLKRFDFVNDAGVDFATYFKRFYKLPYTNVHSSLSHKYCDFTIRFENLQEDFSEVLQLIGIEQKRPLPHINKTGGKGGIIYRFTPLTLLNRPRRCLALL